MFRDLQTQPLLRVSMATDPYLPMEKHSPVLGVPGGVKTETGVGTVPL